MTEPQDPTSNSAKSRQVRPTPQVPPVAPETVEKKVERVVAEGGVVPEKKSVGRKLRDLISGADAKGAVTYVVVEVMLPAARSMAVEVGTKFVERIFYPDSPAPGRRIYGPTMGSRPATYNGMGYRPASTRPPSGRMIETRASTQRPDTGYIIASRADAEVVLERMSDLLDVYQVVTVADLHDLIGISSVHTDNKWGWDNLRGVEIKAVRDGYLITLSPPEPISY